MYVILVGGVCGELWLLARVSPRLEMCRITYVHSRDNPPPRPPPSSELVNGWIWPGVDTPDLAHGKKMVLIVKHFLPMVNFHYRI